jgi:hypothetical protein
LVLHFD